MKAKGPEFTCRPSRPLPGAASSALALPAEAAAAPLGKVFCRGSPPHPPSSHNDTQPHSTKCCVGSPRPAWGFPRGACVCVCVFVPTPDPQRLLTLCHLQTCLCAGAVSVSPCDTQGGGNLGVRNLFIDLPLSCRSLVEQLLS